MSTPRHFLPVKSAARFTWSRTRRSKEPERISNPLSFWLWQALCPYYRGRSARITDDRPAKHFITICSTETRIALKGRGENDGDNHQAIQFRVSDALVNRLSARRRYPARLAG